MYETKTAIIKCIKSFKQDLNKNDVVYSKYTFLSYIFLYHCLVIQIEIIHTEKKLQQPSYLCLFGENWPWHIRNVGCHTQLGKPTQTHHTTQTTQNQS